jgi:hypothetical protein
MHHRKFQFESDYFFTSMTFRRKTGLKLVPSVDFFCRDIEDKKKRRLKSIGSSFVSWTVAELRRHESFFSASPTAFKNKLDRLSLTFFPTNNAYDPAY